MSSRPLLADQIAPALHGMPEVDPEWSRLVPVLDAEGVSRTWHVLDSGGAATSGTMLCVHGNPNVLTPDTGTSSLARGCTGQHVLVEIERFDRELPPVRAYDPPTIRPRRP